MRVMGEGKRQLNEFRKKVGAITEFSNNEVQTENPRGKPPQKKWQGVNKKY